MKIVFILRFFHYIWFSGSENGKVLKFDIAHFPNFEITLISAVL